MLSSISVRTKIQYTSSFKQWWLYCSDRGLDPFLIEVYDLLDFLSQCLSRGSNYGTLNNHRSALSFISGNNIGQDERVKRFFRGVFKLKPSFPRYNCTWNPNIVLNYLSDLYPNENLTLEKLSKKLVMLLALSTGQRCQTLSLIRIPNIMINQNEVKITITDLIKTSGIGKSQPVLDLPFFRQRPAVCPAETLITYLNVTSSNRGHVDNKLILTFKKPFHAASPQTIGRWIKQTLTASGIDTAIFCAHSTRHASSSAAHQAGISVDVIRRTAGWSDQSAIFANFYNRPFTESNCEFANAVLNQ
ncbi:uncharacterized protein LOC126373345 [Pectinophora gossypiella]|uniref:uncharacterized protein LOC126373345 n=1 Tax=Pectinophora gossypiella TaxID=13191 RepID=UPI00214E4317|nr:uncharacterized protein LOC126373345 [Pectinophora gossypiella]